MSLGLGLSAVADIKGRNASQERNRLQAACFAGIMLAAFLLFTVCACYCQARRRQQPAQTNNDEEANVELLEENWEKPPPEEDYEALPEYTFDDAPEYAPS